MMPCESLAHHSIYHLFMFFKIICFLYLKFKVSYRPDVKDTRSLAVRVEETLHRALGVESWVEQAIYKLYILHFKLKNEKYC